MERDGTLKVVIKANVVLDDDLKQLVKLADDIRKEKGCECLLVVSKF